MNVPDTQDVKHRKGCKQRVFIKNISEFLSFKVFHLGSTLTIINIFFDLNIFLNFPLHSRMDK